MTTWAAQLKIDPSAKIGRLYRPSRCNSRPIMVRSTVATGVCETKYASTTKCASLPKPRSAFNRSRCANKLSRMPGSFQNPSVTPNAATVNAAAEVQ